MNKQTPVWRSRAHLLLIPLVTLCLASCAKIDPRQVDVDLPVDLPEIKATSFDKSLGNLGRMSQVVWQARLYPGQGHHRHGRALAVRLW
ncbi:MAG: hypothetical protein RBT36_06930 [Desulfobulbus sp.]|nr:hypothetical protein [Desulfobulbus sp.]